MTTGMMIENYSPALDSRWRIAVEQEMHGWIIDKPTINAKGLVEDMILNACIMHGQMIDENVCKNCTLVECRHAGEPTTKERLNKDFIMMLKDIKKGEFFTLKAITEPNENQVYVKGDYDRTTKTYSCHKFSDINAERFFKSNKLIFTSFTF